MMPRVALACLIGIGCSGTPGTGTIGGDDVPVPDGGSGDPDDTTPPSLVAIADVHWLHQPIRVVFDEPVVAQGAVVTATLAGESLATTVAADGTAIVVTLDPAARGIGTLEVAVSGVADRAGNAAAPAGRTFELAAWDQTEVAGDASPALAVASDGTTYAAWPVAGHVLVTRDGEPFGDPFTGSAPALALDAGERPVVGWLAGGSSHVARWDGSRWRELAAPPGGGAAIALAAGVTVATLGGTTVTVAHLDGDSWQVLGAPLAPAGPPLLADGAVGWIDSGGLRVYRFDGAWRALPPIAGAEHASLATRGDALAVAWDQRAGSYSVLAAELSGTTWRRLGRTLDVDVAGDAREPAIAIDADGDPIVAWHEHVETRERGVIARWSGSAWTIVGGATWLPDPQATTTQPALALASGGAPVVGYRGGVARLNGPRVAGPGLASRASLAGCSFDAAAPPARALQTGCFTLAAPGVTVPHRGLVPYDIVVELWSDGANKRRWIALPDGARMTATPTGAWTAPPGAFVVKQFELAMTPGDPASRRAIETRFLVRTASGWQGFSYRWRLDGSDADLLTDGEWTYDWPLTTGGTHRHLYPSRSECLSCHEGSYGPLLGLRPQQLARWNDYDGTIADQLTTLAAIGVGPQQSTTPFISPHDPSASWEQRTRGYMAANCAHCHNPLHISIKDLRYTTPLAQTKLCDVIVPGDPAGSIVYLKVTSRPGMPALGTLAVDPLAAQLVGTWITGMTRCP